MKIRRLGSSPTISPTMFSYDVTMTNKEIKKMLQGGYCNYRFKQIRNKLDKKLEKELKIKFKK